MNIQGINLAQQAYLNNSKYTKEVHPVLNNPTTDNEQINKPNFKGLGDFIGKLFGKHYAKPMLETKWTRSLAEWMTNQKGNMTEHMATAGSLITSSVYMARTLSNKELEPEKRKTLSINQLLCFIIPTVCAYTVNSILAKFNKKLEHLYGSIQKSKLANGEVSAAQAAEMKKLTSDRLKGFKTLASLATFTLIYRYITPVIITPAANWLGGRLNKRVAEKSAQEQKAQVAVA